jgi:CheY-like chemotaxis protein
MTSEYAILLAEDNEHDIFLTERAFKKAGLLSRLHIVKDGEEAINYLAGKGIYQDRNQFPLPGLVITDIKKPRKSGFDVIKWIRQNPQFKNLQIFILSSTPREELQTPAEKVNCYLTKTVSGADMAEMVHGLAQFVEELQSSTHAGSVVFSGLQATPNT